MKYTKLEDLQNKYPGNENTVRDSYNTRAAKIRLDGKFPENFLTFNLIKIDDPLMGKINVDDGLSDNFRFLVKFIDGDDDTTDDYWTSRGFLADLRTATADSNPYFNREKVTVAEVDFQILRDYWRNEKFVGAIGTKDVDGTGEKYAEVEITETLDTKHEMLMHIDWMISSKEELRVVKDELGNGFGDWELKTTPSLGFSDEFFTGYTAENPYQPYGTGRTGRGRDGDIFNYDGRTPGTDRNGNTVTTVTGSSVPDGRGDTTRNGSGSIDTTNRTSGTDRDGNTTTTTTSDGTSTRTGGRSLFDVLFGR